MSKLNIIFFSSSYFTNPILESIYDNKNINLADLVSSQLETLRQKQVVLPKFWYDSEVIKEILAESEKYEIDINLVVSQPDRQNRDKIIQNPTVIKSKQLGLEIFTPAKINKEIGKFKDLVKECSIVLVASYGQIISEEILNFPKYGFLNWHPSKLPLYRGATPMQTTLFNGESNTALSWIEMSKEMDAGNIILGIDQQIQNSWTFVDLANKMAEIGSQTWALVIAAKIYEHNTNQKISQIQTGEPTFTKYLYKENALIDPKAKTADQIYNQYKGFYQFPGTKIYSEYFGCQLKIISATNYKLINFETIFESPEWLQVKENNKILTFLKCQDKSLLKINQVVLESGKSLNFEGYSFKNNQT